MATTMNIEDDDGYPDVGRKYDRTPSVKGDVTSIVAKFEGMTKILQSRMILRSGRRRSEDFGAKVQQKETEWHADARMAAEEEVERLRKELNMAVHFARHVAQQEKENLQEKSSSSEDTYQDFADVCTRINEDTQVDLLEQQLEAAEKQLKQVEHQLKDEKEARKSVEQQLHVSLLENRKLSGKTDEEALQSLEPKLELAKAYDEIAILKQEKQSLAQSLQQLKEENADLVQRSQNDVTADVVEAQATRIDALKRERGDLLESGMQLSEELYKEQQEIEALLARSLKNKKSKAESSIEKDKAKIAFLKQENQELLKWKEEMSEKWSQDQQEMQALLEKSHKIVDKRTTAYEKAQAKIAALKEENSTLVRLMDTFNQYFDGLETPCASTCTTPRRLDSK